MTKSVFISHSTKDKTFALDLCQRLEKIGVSCWIAPRDIAPGQAYGNAIVEAIEAASVTLLVLSDNANVSPMVENEMERAASLAKTIIPIRIRHVEPSKNLRLFISKYQWVDAYASPISDRVEYIAAVVQAAESKTESPQPAPQRLSIGARIELFLERAFRHKRITVASAALVIFGIAGLSAWNQIESNRLAAITAEATQKTAEIADDIKDSSSTTAESTERLADTLAPELDPLQGQEAMRNALRQGNTTLVQSLASSGIAPTTAMVSSLIAELLGKPDQTRQMLGAFKAALGGSADQGVNDIAQLLKTDFELVKQLAAENFDAATIRSICRLTGKDTPLGKSITAFAQTPEICISKFRDQSIISPLWNSLDQLTWVANEIGMTDFAQTDWLKTVAHPYSDVSRPKSTNSDDEFRTFISLDDYKAVTDLSRQIWSVKPTAQPTQQADTEGEFFLSGQYSTFGPISGQIAISEAAFWREDSMTGLEDDFIFSSLNDVKTAVFGEDKSIIGLFRNPIEMGPTIEGRQSEPSDFDLCRYNQRSDFRAYNNDLDFEAKSRKDQEKTLKFAIESRVYCSGVIAFIMDAPGGFQRIKVVNYLKI